MKRAVYCGACKTLTRAALTYTVRVPVEREQYRPDGVRVITTEPVVMRICHACAAAAGYKVRVKAERPAREKPEDTTAVLFPAGEGGG
jgi:uncharacterized protein (DUF169 family)